MQFFAIPKTVFERLLGFEGGWTTSTQAFPWWTWWTQINTISLPLSPTPSRWFKVLFLVILGYHPHQYVHTKPSQAWWLRSHVFSSQAVEFVKEQLSLSFLMSRKRSTGILNTSLLYLRKVRSNERKLDLSYVEDSKWLVMTENGEEKKSMAWKCVILCRPSLFSGQQATLIWGEKKGESVTSKSLGFGKNIHSSFPYHPWYWYILSTWKP